MSRVVDLSDAIAQVAAWRSASLRVVLANGAFDLLHVGHLRYLEGARALGDRLLVAVNSDRSTRVAKGPHRPVVPAHERAELVAGLRCVDLVLPFDQSDVREIIRVLKPEVHAKGTDYTVASVPERDEVASYGGQTAIVGDPKNHSTTAVVDALGKR